jgi:amino-acid N-acetyltransferase
MPQAPLDAAAVRTSGLLIRPASAADLPTLAALLEREGLLVSDLGRSRPQFIVACAGVDLVGAGALELYASAALLRSLFVARPWRNRGLGHRLVKALERRARSAGVREVVLLTQTASAFFSQLDYRVIERAQAPFAVQLSEEFATLCPASALCMAKMLR